MRAVAKAAAVLFKPRDEFDSEWYCNLDECDGYPHSDIATQYTWSKNHARSKQKPPPNDDWEVWMLMAGRGFGKSRAGAEWLVHQAQTYPKTTWAAMGRTIEQTKKVMFEGESGLLACLDMSIMSRHYNRTTGEITLPNGSVIHKFSAENVESIIGHNLHGIWCDEVSTWHYKEAWDRGVILAVRKSPDGNLRPHFVVTMTPRKSPLVKELVRDPATILTRGTTFENEENLSARAIESYRQKYEGTRRGRQELYGELLEDVPGALWTDQLIESTTIRVKDWNPLFTTKEN